ncbi:MAG: DUF2339 domain-containing protein [Chromatiales bacterium]
MWMLIGAVLGYALGEAGGSVLGFLIGVFVQVLAGQKRKAPRGADKASDSTVDRRLASIEERIAAVEHALSHLGSGGGVGGDRPNIAAPDEAATSTATVAEPAFEPEPPYAPKPDDLAGDFPPANIPARDATATGAAVSEPAPVHPIAVPREASPDLLPHDATAWDARPVEKPPWALQALMNRLLSGNIVAKIGVVTLFFGVGFLLRYAYRKNLLPPWLRLVTVAAVGVALIVTGQRLLRRRRLYALILQGAGVGLLYLDVYFALKTFGILSAGVAFTLFMALGIATLLLAVRHDARPLAVLGLFGAFLAPLLASTGGGNHIVLFSYYAVLNGFVLAISWFKAWRELNLTGFFFTFAIGIAWGARYYRPELFASVEPFVLLFVVTYLIIPILFATRQPPRLKGIVDGSLVFGTPLATAVMQSGLARDLPYGLAWSAAVGCALYAVLAAATIRRPAMRLLGETYVALAVMLLTMAVFFACDAYPTFALWTLEGAAILWVGLRQRRWLARAFGVLLQTVAALYFLGYYDAYDLSNPLFNDFVLGCLLIAVAAWISARLMHLHQGLLTSVEKPAAAAVLAWGCLWYFVGGLHALAHRYDAASYPYAGLVFTGVSFAVMEWLGTRVRWNALRALTAAHVVLLLYFCVATREAGHPLARGGWFAWPFSFVVLYANLHRQRRDALRSLVKLPYVCGWLLLALLATWEGVWRHDHQQYVWTALWGLLGMTIAFLRYRLRERDNAMAFRLSPGVLMWGLFFWFAGWTGYGAVHFAGYREAGLLLLGAVTAGASEVIGRAANWPLLRRVLWALPITILIAAAMQWLRPAHPSAAAGWLAWPLAFAAWYWVVHRHERDAIAQMPLGQHASALVAVVLLTVWELRWWLTQPPWGNGWALAACGLVPALVLWGISRFGRRIEWPFARHFSFYRDNVLSWFAATVLLWSVYAHASSTGDSAPLPYVPLLNPLDLAQAGILIAVLAWLNTADEHRRIEVWLRKPGLALLAFYWLNVALLRTLHHWGNVPFTARDMLESVLVQATLSLAWTATALVLMFMARARAQRQLWMTGAALLAVVVGKLFLNDLQQSGTLATIISFIGVGGLLMLIGYLAPVPPGEREQTGT